MKFLLFCVTFIAVNLLIAGTDYYVDAASVGGTADDTGSGTREKPWRTLQRAFNGEKPCPRASDTVWLRKGIYNDAIVKTGGTSENPFKIKAYPDEAVIIDGNGKNRGFTLESDYLEIDGLTFRNFTKSGYAILAEKKKGININSCDISGARFGIWLTSCEDCNISSSNIHHCEQANIYVERSSNIVLSKNHIHHSGSDGACFHSPAEYVCGQGEIVSLEPAGGNFARLSISGYNFADEKNLAWLTGEGSVKKTVAVLLFNEKIEAAPYKHYSTPIAGGGLLENDGRNWFKLANEKEWGNKPYSADGKQIMINLGAASADSLAQAKYAWIGIFYDDSNCMDIQVLDNDIHDNGRQGILAPKSINILIRNNKIYRCGATGIQIETASRNIWIEGNTTFANSRFYGGECGIWLDENIDAVVQNNITYENQVGMEVTQCRRVICRWNVIYNNKAQHAEKNAEKLAACSMGIVSATGNVFHLGAPSGAEHTFFGHNTVYGNGAETSGWGGVFHHFEECASVANNFFINNLFQENNGASMVEVRNSQPEFNGNVYHAARPAICWKNNDSKKSYQISSGEGFAEYRKDTGQDIDSSYGRIIFVNPGKGDFRLSGDSMPSAKGIPLARTVSEGAGTQIPVDRVDAFSAGFKISTGKILIEGDEIAVGKKQARIISIDRKKKLLGIDRSVSWEKGESVNYKYNGQYPVAGAIDSTSIIETK